jgi:CubicO group peptidase (beta-lactamase class C family)
MDLDAIDRDLAGRAATDQFSGAIRVDQAGNTLLRRGYGWASHAWRVPASPEIRFDTASITKLFTTVAVLQQVEAGHLDLATPAIEYLGLTDTTIDRDITVHHLLSHTSGMADDADEDAGEDYADLFVDEPNYRIREAADHLPHFTSKPANFAPGGGTRYCNVSFVLLGLMIERATGQNYRDYVRERVFEAAGMHRSGFFAMDEVEPDVAEGVEPINDDAGRRTGWRRSIYSYPPIGTPDGGAHSTVDDLITFHTALRAGTLLGRELTDAMLRPHADYGPTQRGRRCTGYGFEIEVVDDVTRAYWKEGHNHGVSGVLRHYPGPDVTVAVLSNLGSGAWEPLAVIDDLVDA